MAEPRIRVDGVSKKFCRDLKRSLWYGVCDLADEAVGRRGARDVLREHEFWAVEDVGFELSEGETLGLIGPNGAGKTTLLRMLNGLIRPDRGRIEVRGRMQALIALGAGFHPILTGRENIYVGGAVLGMPKAEIDRRLDEIIDFSGVEAFIDAPVQSYSSGMAVRLGFAIAIHMDPDILLVDEVLAVGDVRFRARCARKLGELKEQGVPWILVSHDMGTIRNQATRVMLVDRGRVCFDGDPDTAISRYLLLAAEPAVGGSEFQDSPDSGPAPALEARITAVRLLDASGAERSSFATGDAVCLRVDFEADEIVPEPAVGIAFYGSDGTCYTGSNTRIGGLAIDRFEGCGSVAFEVSHLPFLPGRYRVRVDLHDKYMGVVDSWTDAAQLRVDGGAFTAGLFATDHRWRYEKS